MKILFDRCINKYFDKLFTKRQFICTTSKKQLICVFPFRGKKPLGITERLIQFKEHNRIVN